MEDYISEVYEVVASQFMELAELNRHDVEEADINFTNSNADELLFE